MADNDMVTEEQYRLFKKIEAIRKSRGLPGYKDAFEYLLSGFMKQEDLTIDNLEQFQVKQKSFVELLAACKLEVVSPKFTEAGWPLEPIEPYENEWELNDERVFEDTITIDEGFNLLGKMSIRGGQIRCPDGSRRAMEWIAKHPDNQLNYPIILPFLQDNSTNKIIPIFTGFRETNGKTKRTLTMGGLKTIVHPSCRWLILRKQTK